MSSYQVSNLISSFSSLIKSGHNNKCGLKNRTGLITPQLTDDFISLHKKEEKTKSKTMTEDFKLKNDDLYTQKIIQDSTQVIVHCKPVMNSTVSKTLMKEYSESKRYKDDKLILFPEIKESIKEKENNNENYNNNISYDKNDNNESDIDDIEEIIKYQESHLPVPLSRKDDEKFKILKMKQMKRVSMPNNKSVRKFAEDMEPKYEKEFRIHNAFSSMKKKKLVHSTRRIYFSNFFLRKKNKKNISFMIFRDKDIGIYEYWQAHIHESHNDEDVETDDEQKKSLEIFQLVKSKKVLNILKIMVMMLLLILIDMMIYLVVKIGNTLWIELKLIWIFLCLIIIIKMIGIMIIKVNEI